MLNPHVVCGHFSYDHVWSPVLFCRGSLPMCLRTSACVISIARTSSHIFYTLSGLWAPPCSESQRPFARCLDYALQVGFRHVALNAKATQFEQWKPVFIFNLAITANQRFCGLLAIGNAGTWILAA